MVFPERFLSARSASLEGFSLADAAVSPALHAGGNPAAVDSRTDPSLCSAQVLKASWSCCWTRSFNLSTQSLSNREIKFSSPLHLKLQRDILASRSLIPCISLPYQAPESIGRPVFHPLCCSMVPWLSGISYRSSFKGVTLFHTE